ncbi:hypothetical protein HK23_06205 [Acetobacter malorum]|uniref:Uncharacterized protein n=1 Tax=Acetobacter malorum TaxID=178901 RepID=A0A1Y3GAD6_9PROT|nr:hypothetical protein HK23_06205 [Acetobacter malorum]
MLVHGLDTVYDKITLCAVKVMRLAPLVQGCPAYRSGQGQAQYRAKATTHNQQFVTTLTSQILPASPRGQTPRQDSNVSGLSIYGLVVIFRDRPAVVLRNDGAVPNKPGERVC